MVKRIESVDILRGITIIAMILVNTPGTWSDVYAPLLHAKWHGLTPTDLIFPFFLFIIGISIFFAYKDKVASKKVYKKIVVRSLKLIGLGLFLNLFLPYFPFFKEWETLRLSGVLQRIGVVFFVAAVIYLNTNWKTILVICLTTLLVYWIFLGYMPIPGEVMIAPTFERASNNWANYIDLKILGSHMWQPDYDPEGILSTIPSIISALFGVLIGKLLFSLKGRLSLLFFVSFLFLVSGYIFSIWFPVNKAIWSSSFVLVTCGYGSLMLAIIYYLVDIKQVKFGTVFKYVGMNSILIYFLSSFVSKAFYLTKVTEDQNIHSWLFETLLVHDFLSAKLSSLLYALAVVVFYIFLAYALFKRKIFIKV